MMRVRNGFTLVELLIVIIVIAILAAITVVAYNGVTNQAKTSAAQASARQAFMKVKTYAVENSDSYPNSVADVGLTDTSDTTYQYRSNNTTNPKTFCLTVTKSNVSYYVSDTSSTPTAGACAGHGVNGVAAITNLVKNPSMEVDTTGYGTNLVTATRVATGQSGSWHLAVTRSSTGDSYAAYFPTGFVVANNTFTVSLWAKGNGLIAISSISFVQEHGGAYRNFGSLIAAGTVIPSTWTRYSVTFTAPSDAATNLRIILRTGPAIGDLIDYDSIMITQGTTLYAYADGSSPGWIWNGTPNNSTSTGPPL